ncbi:YecR family lipoprotein [Salinicola halophyticus]|uniref:YecR family lipoprotein n=1 Tax=Salinicola halophyticus TaxID=1808881 RepID=UPI003F478B68
MKYLIMILFAGFLLAGCAVHKTMVPTGGSKADGTIDLSYDVSMFETPEVNAQQGLNAAAKRCQAWGYSDAEPFGGATSQCVAMGGYGCNTTRYTMTYQCLDN